MMTSSNIVSFMSECNASGSSGLPARPDEPDAFHRDVNDPIFDQVMTDILSQLEEYARGEGDEHHDAFFDTHHCFSRTPVSSAGARSQNYL